MLRHEIEGPLSVIPDIINRESILVSFPMDPCQRLAGKMTGMSDDAPQLKASFFHSIYGMFLRVS